MALQRQRSPRPSSASVVGRSHQKLARNGCNLPRGRGRGGRSRERGYGGTHLEGGKRLPVPPDSREGISKSDFHDRHSDYGATAGLSGRRPLEPQSKSYFLEILTLIDGGAKAEDVETICAQALEEARGQELQLACDASCGRVVELLLQHSDVSRNVQFLLGCGSIVIDMAVDPSGSHIVEAVLKSLARSLLDENVCEQDWYNSLELALTMLCQQLGSIAMRVVTNRYGSHVLRCLLSLLSGESSEILSPAGSEVNFSRGLASKVGAFASRGKHGQLPRPSGRAFPVLLKSLAGKILEGCWGQMAALRADSSGGPVLQVLLSAMKASQMNEDIVRAITAILGGDPKKSSGQDGKLLESVSVEEVISMMEDKNSSHLMEVIIRMASDALYLEIFRRFLRKRLVHLSLHPSANFIVQVLIACARHEGQVNMMFEELEVNFAELLRNKRAGVIAALLAACGRFRTRQKESCRALVVAMNPNRIAPSLDVVPRLLQMETALDEGSLARDMSCAKLSVIGSVILQTVLTFPQECSQQFSASIAAIESTGLLPVVKNSSGSRVVEVFLESSAVTMKHKLRVISKLEGHFAELALHPIGCFVLERCFELAEIRRKEKIAAELAPVHSDLMKTRSGARISRRCDVEGYIENPDQWRVKENSRHSTQKAFVAIFKPGEEQEVVSGVPEEEELFVKTIRKHKKGRKGKGGKALLKGW